MQILQIDDSKALSQMYKDLFTHRGYKFESTTDGKVGLELARKNNYDVILLDMLMPKYGGMQFLADLKKIKPSELKKVMIVSMMEFEDEEIKKLKEFGIHSVQKKSIKLVTNLVDSIYNIEHLDQNKKKSEELKAKKIEESKIQQTEMEYKIIEKQNEDESKIQQTEPSEKTIKKIKELKLQIKESKNQITKLNQELRSARILKKYKIEQLKELQKEISNSSDHHKELEKTEEIKITTTA